VERLRTLAVKGDLTSLYNLRFFNRSLETEHQRATRFGRSYSLIFLDLDGLREVNTRDGHMAGAQVLKHVGEFLIQRIRRIDLPARIGGDEFVVICPETEKVAVRLVAERLRHGIQRLQNEQEKPLGITTSIGIASFPEDGDLPEEILQRADRALYEAKALGKNRVCCWGDFAIGNDDKGFQGSVHGNAAAESGSGTLKAVRKKDRKPPDEG
jgi:diguanylate cyclase (GGDEF)-like protein